MHFSTKPIQHTAQKDFAEALQVLTEFVSNPKNLESIEEAGVLMIEALQNNKKIISCGNGGSMCDAMHFAEELSGRFRDDRPAMAAIAISDAAHLTCVANDYGFDQVFARYVAALGQPGDVLLAISTSGNSANIVLAAQEARKKGMKVVSLTGKDGGKIAEISDVEIRAPKTVYSDRVQEIHIKAIHTLINFIEKNS